MSVTDSVFLKACRREATDRIPVWFMRQAGRALPEYRAARGPGSILDAIRRPELAAELTLQPVARYGVDAAILFSDIVVPVAALGFGVEIEQGVGPVVARPFRTADDLDRLRALDPENDTPYVLETVRLVTKALAADGVPLIGFAGAPFTVASYLIEGGPSRDYTKTMALMKEDPALWARLLETLAEVALSSLRSQVAAGVSAVQLFDSWAGALSAAEYEKSVLPASRRVLGGLADLGVPRIHFGMGTGHLLPLMAAAGADVVGVDWRTPLDQARTLIGPGFAVQGNLNPSTCLEGFGPVRDEARDVIARGGGTGHIFNLGHGVLPQTDPAVLEELVGYVHDQKPGQPGSGR
ncbi:MAG TPA: uroporphyrinogen decarboxylase [Acidimicrobiales bacterium]